ncbi:MAG: DUF1848 domain-containing protein [Lachnospiraceae bacterium]|jgi:hypothetical protein|nr:DUF1848 domain-containing protein [Lachnospiraceae bacterium]
MIISASRRTDIPSYYSEWLFNRIKEGFVYVRNPMNIHQVSKLSLDPAVVDGLVLWTKNPAPMLGRLNGLADYSYYFQFTLTPYQTDVETNLPSKEAVIIPVFQALSDQIGLERVIWRYDPIFLNEKYTLDYHFTSFGEMAYRLKDYTKKCTISFIDLYRSTARAMQKLGIKMLTDQDKDRLAQGLSRIAHEYGIVMETCAEGIDLHKYGIVHAKCIDEQLFEAIAGYGLKIAKDKSQRLECGCVASRDIGMYDSCANGCRYCYANHRQQMVGINISNHDPRSPLLCGTMEAGDVLKEIKTTSNKMKTSSGNINQMSIFDQDHHVR